MSCSSSSISTHDPTASQCPCAIPNACIIPYAARSLLSSWCLCVRAGAPLGGGGVPGTPRTEAVRRPTPDTRLYCEFPECGTRPSFYSLWSPTKYPCQKFFHPIFNFPTHYHPLDYYPLDGIYSSYPENHPTSVLRDATGCSSGQTYTHAFYAFRRLTEPLRHVSRQFS